MAHKSRTKDGKDLTTDSSAVETVIYNSRRMLLRERGQSVVGVRTKCLFQLGGSE